MLKMKTKTAVLTGTSYAGNSHTLHKKAILVGLVGLVAAPFVPGYTLGDIYTAGLDPYTERPLKVTDFCLDALGRPHVEFNGYKGETPVGYQMLYSSTPDFKSPVVLQLTDGNFDGDAATWSTMWNGKVPSGDSGAGFYRVKAVR